MALLHKINRTVRDSALRAVLGSTGQVRRPLLCSEVNKLELDSEEALGPQRLDQGRERASLGNKQLQAQEEALDKPNQQEEGSSEAKATTIKQPELVSLVHPTTSWAQAQPLASSRILRSQAQELEGCSVELRQTLQVVSLASLHSHKITPLDNQGCLDKLLIPSQQLLCLVEDRVQEPLVLVACLGLTRHNQRLVVDFSELALARQVQVAQAVVSSEQHQLELLEVDSLELSHKQQVEVSSATQVLVPSLLVQAHLVSS